jgi:UDP-glucose 4-epimerase
MIKVENLIIVSFYKGFLNGSAGYVTYHTCVDLLDVGMDVTEFDNFCNSHPLALARLEQVAGKKPTLLQGDIRYRAALGVALHLNCK